MKLLLTKIVVGSILVVGDVFSMKQQAEDQVWDGQYYHDNSRPQYKAAMQHLKSIPFRNGSSIVDIGCGPGNITAVIADRFPQSIVVGTDVSQDMISAAQRIYRDRTNLSFRVRDAQNMDYDESFDIGLSLLTLHWLENKPAFFRGLFKSLKPDGEFFVTVGTKNSEMEALKGRFFAVLLQDAKWNFLLKTDMATANNAVSKDEVQKMAQEAGFKDVEIHEEIERHDFNSVEELADFFSTFVSGFKDIAALPSETRQEFVKTAARIWVDTVGKTLYMWANLVVRGKKPNANNQSSKLPDMTGYPF